MASNRQSGLRWRNEVILHLHDAGIGAARTPTGSMLTNSREQGNNATILGLPWALVTRCERRMDFSDGLRRAATLADDQHKLHFASITYRRDHEVADAYVTMPLSIFTEILKAFPAELDQFVGSMELAS